MAKILKFWDKITTFLVGVVFVVFPELISSVTIKSRIIYSIIGFFFMLLSFFITKLFRRVQFFIIRLKRIKIGISIDNPINSEIVDFCNEEIKSLGLHSKITFESFKIKGESQKRFEKIVKNSNFDVVVWTDKRIRIKNSNKVSLQFTYKNTSNRLISRIVRNELTSLVAREKMFSLNNDTINIDLHLEKNNIADFSLYIVAICTTLFRGINEGIFVFEKLCEKIKNKEGLLKNNSSRRLKDLYSFQGRDLIIKRKFLPGILMLEKAYALDENDCFVLANFALAKFKTGDEDGAEKMSEKLLQNNTNFPIAHLDGAFFRLRNKKYKSALRHYIIAANQRPDPAILLDVIGFLSKELDKDSKEVGYLFARGFLKRLLNSNNPDETKVGESNYVEDFLAFINRADKTLYKDMIETVEKYILKVSKIQKIP